MPKMSGLELYREIRKIDNKVKVCFITAFDIHQDDLKKEFQSSSNTTLQDNEAKVLKISVILKPIDIDTLAKRLRTEINS